MKDLSYKVKTKKLVLSWLRKNAKGFRSWDKDYSLNEVLSSMQDHYFLGEELYYELSRFYTRSGNPEILLLNEADFKLIKSDN